MVVSFTICCVALQLSHAVLLTKSFCQTVVFCAVTLALASATAIEFHKVDAFAGKILLPYVAWLVFANALNYSIWKKNPGVRFMRATLQLTGVLAAYSLRNSLCLLYQAE